MNCYLKIKLGFTIAVILHVRFLGALYMIWNILLMYQRLQNIFLCVFLKETIKIVITDGAGKH